MFSLNQHVFHKSQGKFQVLTNHMTAYSTEPDPVSLYDYIRWLIKSWKKNLTQCEFNFFFFFLQSYSEFIVKAHQWAYHTKIFKIANLASWPKKQHTFIIPEICFWWQNCGQKCTPCNWHLNTLFPVTDGFGFGSSMHKFRGNWMWKCTLKCQK